RGELLGLRQVQRGRARRPPGRAPAHRPADPDRRLARPQVHGRVEAQGLPEVGALSERFGARLAARVEERRSQVVLGLDPDPARLWPEAVEAAPAAGSPAERAAAAVEAHCAALIAAAAPACVAAKPQVACFERLGAPGWAALKATCERARAAGL